MTRHGISRIMTGPDVLSCRYCQAIWIRPPGRWSHCPSWKTKCERENQRELNLREAIIVLSRAEDYIGEEPAFKHHAAARSEAWGRQIDDQAARSGYEGAPTIDRWEDEDYEYDADVTGVVEVPPT